MAGHKVTVKLRRGGVRRLDERFANVLIKLGKADLVVATPATPPGKPQRGGRRAKVQPTSPTEVVDVTAVSTSDQVSEEIAPDPDGHRSRTYRRTDLQAEG